MSATIKIYKASAGSGKTYRLAYEYVLLLFRNRACAHPHRSTLAATFTNKATDEMKRRIVRELFALAHDANAPFLAELTQDLKSEGLSQNDIRQWAQRFLSDLLHDYSAFNVSTIDRFFQQIVRAFTREIGLQGDFGVELNRDSVLKMAVDNMLFELDRPENQPLLVWLKQYISETLTPQTDSDKPTASWMRFRTNIETLGQEIFKESYLQYADQLEKQLEDKKFFATYRQQLYAAKVEFEQRVRAICNRAMQIRQKHHLQWSDFSGKERSFTTYFDYDKLKSKNFLLTTTFRNAIDNIDKWSSAKSLHKTAIEAAFNDGLNACAHELNALNVREYLSVCVVYEHIYMLGILNDVRRQIINYCKEKNIMLIGSTTDFLNQITKNCDTPFVYEKTGTYLHHFMLDEFQDTSQLQWQNFKPLLYNSVSENNRNLIVGDVKQSIYRWRSSDWRLLQSGIQQDFAGYISDEVLNTNWRSAQNVVAFNNEFFSYIPTLVQDVVSGESAELVRAIYAEVRQQPHRTMPGRVSVELLANDDTCTWQQRVLQRLPEMVDELTRNNYALNQITVLVRKNSEAVQVADALLAAGYKVVSNEALLVANAACIRLLVAMMRFFVEPSNTLNRKLIETLLTAYNPATMPCCQPSNETAEMWLQRVFPDTHTDIMALHNQPLFQLTEGLILTLQLHGTVANDVFLQAFQDVVFDYTAHYTNDLNGFLEYWDEQSDACFLPASDTQEAIRIMTIHKSKGLEFKAVIIPFCQWDCNAKGIVWCQTPTDHPLLGTLPIVPLKAKSLLTNTHFKSAYETEQLYTLVDSVNVAYVAFTRAENDLYILGPKTKNTQNASASLNIVNMLERYVRSCQTMHISVDDDTRFLAQMGELQPLDAGAEQQTAESLTLTYDSVSALPRLKLRYTPDDAGSERHYGLLMHDILSQLRTADELPKILQTQMLNGKLTAEQLPQVQNTINQLLDNEQARAWFSGKYRVLNETEIITPQGLLYRPDRVMMAGTDVVVVDYKFGTQHEPRYNKQVQRYANLISRMGFAVQGFIWYAQTNELEQIC